MPKALVQRVILFILALMLFPALVRADVAGTLTISPKTNGGICSWSSALSGLSCGGTDDDVPDAGDYGNLTGGTGITNNPTGTINTASDETGFLSSGSLTCGAGTAGKMLVHTTPLQYCDNTATPILRYSAYGDSSGNALTANALTTNPNDCLANQYATTIGANGNLTCAQVSGSQVTNTPSGDISSTNVQAAINELDTEKVAKSGVQSLTIADSGNGSHATDSSTTISGNTLAVTCSDADGCDLTLSESGVVDGQTLLVNNVGTSNPLYLVQSAGVAQMCAGATISLAAKTSNVTKSAQFRYVTDRWQQDCRQTEWSDLNNVPAFRKTLVQFRPNQYLAPASNYATLNTRDTTTPIPVLNFDTTTSECALWTFVLPNWYGGNGVTAEIWTVAPTATSGTVQWDVYFERVEATQDMDSVNSGFASAQSTSATSVSGTSGVPIKQTVAFTDGAQMDSCAAGEYCILKVCRNVAGDNLAEDASMVMLEIKETP